MDYPQEFLKLAFNALLALDEDIKSEDQLRDLLLKDLSTDKLRRLDAYLAEILDGRYSDEELRALWEGTRTDFMIYRPEGTRIFLHRVREWLQEAGLH